MPRRSSLSSRNPRLANSGIEGMLARHPFPMTPLPFTPNTRQISATSVVAISAPKERVRRPETVRKRHWSGSTSTHTDAQVAASIEDLIVVRFHF